MTFKVGDTVKHGLLSAVVVDELVHDKSKVIVRYTINSSVYLVSTKDLCAINYVYLLGHAHTHGYFIMRRDKEDKTGRHSEYFNHHISSNDWQVGCLGCYCQDLPYLVSRFKQAMGEIDLVVFEPAAACRQPRT